MENSIFRQKNIDKINSPESLNDYLKVTNPSVWIILIGIIILISGAFVFAAFGRMDTNVKAAVYVKDGLITAYVDENDIEVVRAGMSVKVDGVEYTIKSINDNPVKYMDVDEYLLHKASMESSKWLFLVNVNGTLDDGTYVGSITVEQTSPISYVFN